MDPISFMNDKIQSACEELGVQIEPVSSTLTLEQFKTQWAEDFKQFEAKRMEQIAQLKAEIANLKTRMVVLEEQVEDARDVLEDANIRVEEIQVLADDLVRSQNRNQVHLECKSQSKV